MSANSAWPPPHGQAGPGTEQSFGLGVGVGGAGMEGIGEQDFANLLDFESFDFLSGFNDGTGNNNDTGAQQQQHKNPNGVDLNLAAAGQAHQQQQRGDGGGQNMFDMGMQMPFGQHGQGFGMGHQHGQGVMQHQMVPPTPNSVEMHGDVGRYLQQLDAQTRAIIEHEYKMRQQDSMNFTPLGTPAVTPHDSQFNPAAQFAVPGEYFSPLVSPALEGQQQQRGQHTSGSTASTASPVDFDMDLLGDAASQPQQKQPRRTRRQSASTRGGGGNRRVAQSPIQKPASKRKSGLSSVIPPKEVSELLEMHAHSRMSPTSPISARLGRPYASSSDSISPEPLCEGLMRPPPKPHSAKASPAILAHSKSHSQSPNLGPNGVGTMPATPASLMRIHPKDSPNMVSVPQTIHESHGDDIPMLDDLILPEAAATMDPRSGLAKLDTAAANGDATPRVSARRGGPKSAPLLGSGTGTGTPTTAKPSPLASASTVTSPTPTASPNLGRKPTSRGPTSKSKRGSVSNQLVSPALLPRISPSIKPLLPSGAVDEKLTEEQHALLLTSRSNYQNLIEGRNIPGVTYPSDLPSQLTSKRTSHKIAEQGRRQRINVALQEMQGLLPKLSPAAQAKLEDGSDDEEEEGTGGKGGKKGGKGGGNSKAATVEHAILYIKTMQGMEQQWAKEREEKDKEVEALRRKLEALERRLSVSKSPGSMVDGGSMVEGVEEVADVGTKAEGTSSTPNGDEGKA